MFITYSLCCFVMCRSNHTPTSQLRGDDSDQQVTAQTLQERFTQKPKLRPYLLTATLSLTSCHQSQYIYFDKSLFHYTNLSISTNPKSLKVNEFTLIVRTMSELKAFTQRQFPKVAKQQNYNITRSTEKRCFSKATVVFKKCLLYSCLSFNITD